CVKAAENSTFSVPYFNKQLPSFSLSRQSIFGVQNLILEAVMRLRRSVFATRFLSLSALFTFLKVKGLRRQLLALTLILSLLILPVQGTIFEQAGVWASTSIEIAKAPVNFASKLFEKLFSNTKTKIVQQETMASRAALVSRIRITPFKLVAYIGET